MFEQRVRFTFGMYDHIPAKFLGAEKYFEIYTGQRSLTGQIPYEDVKFLSVDEFPIGADGVFWLLACLLCFIPIIGWCLIPLLYLLRNETVLGITCGKTYFSLHGSSTKLEAIWRFLEARTGRILHKDVVKAGKPSFTDESDSLPHTIKDPVTITRTTSQPILCAICGTPLEVGDSFCGECGAKV